MVRRFLLMLAFGAVMAAASAPREVILVGTVHNLHLKPQYHYSIPDLGRQIAALHPDLVCGEITPEAYQGPMEGYFPPEAAYLAEIAPGFKARFVPVDWRMARIWQRRAGAMESPEVQKRVEGNMKTLLAWADSYNGPSLFDLVHSRKVLDLTDEQFEQVIGENTVSDLAAGAWHERNRRIVENALAAATDRDRVVIVFGSSHIPQLIRQLKARGIQPVVAGRLFTPSGPGAVPASVRARWARNLENLRALQEGRIPATADDLAKVKDSHRIQDLEEVLGAYPGS